MPSRPADSAMIDVACPACGEVYHLRPDSVGKQIECVNKLCRQRFVVQPPGTGPLASGIESGKTGPGEFQMPEVLGARAVDVVPGTDKAQVPADDRGAGVPPVPTAEDDAPPIQIAPANAGAADLPPDSTSGVGVSPVSEKTGGTQTVEPLAGGTPALQPSAGGAPTPQAAGRRKRRRGQPRWAVVLEAVSAAALVVLASYVGVLKFQEWSKTPAEEWKKAQALYQDHKWEHARAVFNNYAKRFPEEPETATVPFFLDMCDAGDEVYSPTGDLARGVTALERLFQSHRDSPAYHEYAGDLFQALGRVIERSVERAKQFSDLDDLKQAKKADDDIARARQAQELLRTVAEAMKDAWVPDRVEQLHQTIDTTARAVKLNLTRTEIVANFRRVPGFPLEKDLAAVYAHIEGLLHDEPELAGDAQVLKEQALAHRSEAARVRYRPQAEKEPSAGPSRSPAGKTLAVVWQPAEQRLAGETPMPQAPAGETPARQAAGGDASAVVVALAQGVLYAFDTTGKPLWARRLGLDVDRLPARAAVGAAGGELLIARSTAEQALVALEAASGDERWRFASPAKMTAPVTLVSVANQNGDAPLRRAWLPTADGRIYVLEPVLGQPLGYYETGWPLTVGGAYDAQTKRIFFAADSDRVLAIDPAATENPQPPACSSVLFTRHAGGSLRREPLVVGPYLVLLEGFDLDRSRLRAWPISKGGFADPDVAPLAEQNVAGWSWFAPQASPDRVLFATDQGELGLFGLNLDNPSEAIYRLIEDPAQPPSTVLPTASGTRTLLAYAENQSLWVQAGSSLRRLTMDVLRQEVKRAWAIDEAASEASIPLHEAQTREAQRRPFVYLATMTADANRFEFAAREADRGAAIWRRQLGLRPVGAPFVDHGRILMADRSGRIAALSIDDAPPNATMLVEPADVGPLADIAGAPLLIDDAEGRPWLFVRIAHSSGVALRPLEPGKAWQRLQPPAEVLGTPCLLAGALVAACSDGSVHRLTTDATAAVNEQPFVWFAGERAPHTAISLTPIGQETVLLCDGRSVRRLQYQVRDSVGQWTELGERYSADVEIKGRPLVHGEHVFVATAPGIVEALDANNPVRALHRWSLPGAPTSDLFVRAGYVMVVVDDQLLVSLTAVANDFADNFTWTNATPTGAICGQPQLYGSSLIVADTGGTVRALNVDDGRKLWETKLGPGQAPAATPVIIADRFLLVPLIDGTLTLAALPVPGEQRPRGYK